jgi:hypothetical protein
MFCSAVGTMSVDGSTLLGTGIAKRGGPEKPTDDIQLHSKNIRAVCENVSSPLHFDGSSILTKSGTYVLPIASLQIKNEK